MWIKTLAAGAALSMLVVGGSALAQTTTKGSAQLGPAQPIPYEQLKTYQKASPKARASKDWSASASTGAATDTSAMAPAPSGSMPSSSMSGDAKSSTMPDTAVNPPADSLPQTPAILPGTPTSPEPGSNLPGTAPMPDPMTPK